MQHDQYSAPVAGTLVRARHLLFHVLSSVLWILLIPFNAVVLICVWTWLIEPSVHYPMKPGVGMGLACLFALLRQMSGRTVGNSITGTLCEAAASAAILVVASIFHSWHGDVARSIDIVLRNVVARFH